MHSLHLTVWIAPLWRFDLPLQLHTVRAISACLPTARSIRLCQTVEWRWRRHDKEERGSMEGEWEPVLLPLAPHKISVYAMLKGMLRAGLDARVRDCGGVLAGLFDPTLEDDALYLRHLRGDLE